MRLSVLFTAVLMAGASVAISPGSQVGEPMTLLEVDFESMNAKSVFAGDGSAMRAEGTPPLILCELKSIINGIAVVINCPVPVLAASQTGVRGTSCRTEG
jgi:hypothetical protein